MKDHSRPRRDTKSFVCQLLILQHWIETERWRVVIRALNELLVKNIGRNGKGMRMAKDRMDLLQGLFIWLSFWA
jgi:hypothetical protein